MPDSGLRVVFGPEKAPRTGRPTAKIPPSFADGCLDLNGCSNPEANQSTGLRQDSKGSCPKVRTSGAGTDAALPASPCSGEGGKRVVLSRAVML